MVAVIVANSVNKCFQHYQAYPKLSSDQQQYLNIFSYLITRKKGNLFLSSYLKFSIHIFAKMYAFIETWSNSQDNSPINASSPEDNAS